MVIESDGKMTKAQAREVANVSLQGRMLMKKPEAKIKDFFRFCIGASIFCVVIMVIMGYMAIRGKGDALIYICLGMTIVALVMAFSVYLSASKIYKTLLGREGRVKVTLDDGGVEYDDHGSRKIKQSWSAISFVRQCQEMIYFMPSDATGLLVCVSAEYAAGVKEFLQAGDVKVKAVWKKKTSNNGKDETTVKTNNVKNKPTVKIGHYINIKGRMVPTRFESKELQFDHDEFKKESDYCKDAPTGHANIYGNYLECINRCESSGDQKTIDEIKNLFQQVKQEIYRGIVVPRELSEEEICYLASLIAFYSCNNHGLSGYCAGKVYIEILTTECINCLLFTMIFDEEADNAYLIAPEFVKGNDWIQKYVMPLTLKNKLRIYVLLDKDLITISQKTCEDGNCSFGLWDVVNDQCFAVIRQSIVFEEIEDGYPIEITGYKEWFEPMEKTVEITEKLNQCVQASEQTRRKVVEGHYVG